MRCPALAASHPLRSWSGVATYKQILELGPVVDDLTNEPTFRLNLQIEMSHLLKCRADQTIAVTTAAQQQGHLGVEYCHDVSGNTVVRDGDTGRRIHLEPVQLCIVANGIRLHVFLITRSMSRDARAQTNPRILRSSLFGPFRQQLVLRRMRPLLGTCPMTPFERRPGRLTSRSSWAHPRPCCRRGR